MSSTASCSHFPFIACNVCLNVARSGRAPAEDPYAHHLSCYPLCGAKRKKISCAKRCWCGVIALRLKAHFAPLTKVTR